MGGAKDISSSQMSIKRNPIRCLYNLSLHVTCVKSYKHCSQFHDRKKVYDESPLPAPAPNELAQKNNGSVWKIHHVQQEDKQFSETGVIQKF
jgi:hypothetical protein